LGIAKVIDFVPGTYVLDVGPVVVSWNSISDSIPETRFYLIDIIAKKIKVVQAVVDVLELKNVKTEQLRAELVKGDFDFIVSRAVTNMPDFVSWIKDKVKKKQA
jgi:16S rRNA (guanine527-N7)-methyltransferase